MLIRDVRVIDGVGEAALAARDVLVDGDRIVAIEPHDPARDLGGHTNVLEGAGRTLLPGLIDAHAHYTLDPTEGSLAAIAARSDAEIVLMAAGHAARALRAGVTTARGAGSIRNLEIALRDAIAAGRVPGPRLVAAGTAVGITGGHGFQFGLEADGPAALVTATRRVVRDGADVVKVIASEAAMLTTTGLASGRTVEGAPELTSDELRAIVATAAELRVRGMSHAQVAEAGRRAAAAGVASVEHAWLADAAAMDVLAASGAWLVPTLVVTDVNWTLPGLTPRERERQDRIERTHRASTEAAIARGVPMATGTDTGEVGVTPPQVWREIALLHDHGASAMAAIKAATASGARLLGIDDEVGTVQVGKRADLVLVDGDPLTDLRRLADPVAVVQGGNVVSRR